MAVRAEQITLRYLSHEALHRHTRSERDVEPLGVRVAVMELHHHRRVGAPTAYARRSLLLPNPGEPLSRMTPISSQRHFRAFPVVAPTTFRGVSSGHDLIIAWSRCRGRPPPCRPRRFVDPEWLGVKLVGLGVRGLVGCGLIGRFLVCLR